MAPLRISKIIQDEMIISSDVINHHWTTELEKQVSLKLMWNGHTWITRCLKKENGEIELEGWKDFKEHYCLRNGDILFFGCEPRRMILRLFDKESGAEIFQKNKPFKKAPKTASKSFTKYIPEIRYDMRSYVEDIIDVESDGNCGYRCLALLGETKNENNWPIVRKNLLRELMANESRYRRCYGNAFEKIALGLNWLEGPTESSRYWMITDMGSLIASTYGVVFVILMKEGGITFLPMGDGLPPKELDIWTIAHVEKKHFVVVSLKKAFPWPIIDLQWKFEKSCKNEVAIWLKHLEDLSVCEQPNKRKREPSPSPKRKVKKKRVKVLIKKAIARTMHNDVSGQEIPKLRPCYFRPSYNEIGQETPKKRTIRRRKPRKNNVFDSRHLNSGKIDEMPYHSDVATPHVSKATAKDDFVSLELSDFKDHFTPSVAVQEDQLTPSSDVNFGGGLTHKFIKNTIREKAFQGYSLVLTVLLFKKNRLDEEMLRLLKVLRKEFQITPEEEYEVIEKIKKDENLHLIREKKAFDKYPPTKSPSSNSPQHLSIEPASPIGKRLTKYDPAL